MSTEKFYTVEDLISLRWLVRQSSDKVFTECVEAFSAEQLKRMVLCYLDTLRSEKKIMLTTRKNKQKRRAEIGLGIRSLTDMDYEILKVWQAKMQGYKMATQNQAMEETQMFKIPTVCFAMIYDFFNGKDSTKESFHQTCIYFYRMSRLQMFKHSATLDLAKLCLCFFFILLTHPTAVSSFCKPPKKIKVLF